MVLRVMEGASRDWFSHFSPPLPSFSTARTVCRLPLSLHPDLFLHPAGVLFVLPAGKLLLAGSFPLYSDNLKQTKKPQAFSICTVSYTKPTRINNHNDL